MKTITIDLDNLTIKQLEEVRNIMLATNHLREADLIFTYIKDWKEQYDRN